MSEPWQSMLIFFFVVVLLLVFILVLDAKGILTFLPIFPDGKGWCRGC